MKQIGFDWCGSRESCTLPLLRALLCWSSTIYWGLLGYWGVLGLRWVLTLLVPAGNDCETFWDKDHLTNSCYQFNFQSTLSWREAWNSCEQQGANLLSITEIHEQTYINGETAAAGLCPRSARLGRAGGTMATAGVRCQPGVAGLGMVTGWGLGRERGD